MTKSYVTFLFGEDLLYLLYCFFVLATLTFNKTNHVVDGAGGCVAVTVRRQHPSVGGGR